MKGKRTVIVAAIISILGIVQTTAGDILPQESVGPVLTVVGILVGALRAMTDTPMFQTDPPEPMP